MKHATPSSELLKRYLGNSCTEAERELVNDWYQSLDTGQEELVTAADEQKLYRRIQTQISEQMPERMHRPVFRTYVLRIAAVLCVGLGLIFYFNSKNKPDTVAGRKARADSVRFENRAQQISRHILPDSSQIWMNPGAKVCYLKSFEKRNVRFSGEGFFDVTRDKSRPFTIYSGDMKTRVLGTSFNVRANANEATCQVTVVTGMVEVASVKKGQPIILRPKQQAVFAKTSNVTTVTTFPGTQPLIESWQSVSLVFDEVPMSEVAERLNKIFRVSIEFANPAIRNCQLKVDLNDQRLPEILEMINVLLGTTYQMEEKKITFRGDGCN